MLIGRVARDGGSWVASCDALQVTVESDSQSGAREQLGATIEQLAELKIVVEELDTDGDGTRLAIASPQRHLLAAFVLRRNRQLSGLSLADVAVKLGAKSRTTFAAYEHGEREPSISKYVELLATVAPELCVVVDRRIKKK